MIGGGKTISQPLIGGIDGAGTNRKPPTDSGAGGIEGPREPAAGELIRQSGQKAFIDDPT